jgi:hypothetical protein
MTRVLSSACVVFLLLFLGGRAYAAGKPPIAILGLEVYDNGGGIDPEITKAAKDFTAALRDRAKAGTGPYTPVQGGEKELIDEKLLNNCDTEAASCMAAIGNELGAEVLLYGKIEKVNQSGQVVYKVSLKLLQVGRKQTSSMVETFPVVDAGNDVKVSASARAWYTKLVGGTGGTLVIKAGNIDRGTVLIDGDEKGNLASGSLTLQALPEGRHTLAIEPPKGYQRYEARITVRAGEVTTQSVTMVELSKKPTLSPKGDPLTIEGTVGTGTAPTRSPKTNVWKPVFYGTTALGLAGAGFAFYEWRQQVDNANHTITTKGPNKGSVTEADCGALDSAPSMFNMIDGKLRNACKAHDRWKLGVIIGSVAGAAAISSFIMAYVRNSGSESETKTSDRGHRKRRELVVTPVITAQGGGATLQFDW